ncbi:hypothetical protein [Roseiconus lacunae]|uniref:Uncharacterized protein n=1 Tax=Roseiconus lacunae TaxID=2605694 RepID=A0ABT7PH97_9BACT|nr:hypothetical protein [Roseiconus lacunae]MDM4015858.1 hypothetical protein [Roseiconus lacunae]
MTNKTPSGKPAAPSAAKADDKPKLKPAEVINRVIGLSAAQSRALVKKMSDADASKLPDLYATGSPTSINQIRQLCVQGLKPTQPKGK